MRLLHTIYDDVENPWLGGGGAVRASELNRRLAGDHDITVVCGRYPGAPETEDLQGVRVRRVGCEDSYAKSRLGFIAEASAIVGRGDFDVWVYTFSAFSPVLAGADSRRRSLLEFYHHMGHHALRKRPLAGLPAMAAEYAVLRLFPTIVGISPSVVEEIRRRRGSDGLHLIYTGVDERFFHQPIREDNYVLYFGRFDIHTKGLDILLPAFAAGCGGLDVRLVLAGRGTDDARKWVLEEAHRLGIVDRIEIVGPVSEEEKAELLGSCLFTAQPSRYEGWGITAMEASATGKAVVGTRIPGLVDAIRDGETGILVPPEDTTAFSKAMNQMATDPDLRKRLGDAGRVYARGFTWDRMAQEHIRICNQIAEGSSTDG